MAALGNERKRQTLFNLFTWNKHSYFLLVCLVFPVKKNFFFFYRGSEQGGGTVGEGEIENLK